MNARQMLGRHAEDPLRVGRLTLTGIGTVTHYKVDPSDPSAEVTLVCGGVQVRMVSKHHASLLELQAYKGLREGSRVKFAARPLAINGVVIQVATLIPSPDEPFGSDELLLEVECRNPDGTLQSGRATLTVPEENMGAKAFAVEAADGHLLYTPIVVSLAGN